MNNMALRMILLSVLVSFLSPQRALFAEDTGYTRIAGWASRATIVIRIRKPPEFLAAVHSQWKRMGYEDPIAALRSRLIQKAGLDLYSQESWRKWGFLAEGDMYILQRDKALLLMIPVAANSGPTLPVLIRILGQVHPALFRGSGPKQRFGVKSSHFLSGSETMLLHGYWLIAIGRQSSQNWFDQGLPPLENHFLLSWQRWQRHHAGVQLYLHPQALKLINRRFARHGASGLSPAFINALTVEMRLTRHLETELFFHLNQGRSESALYRNLFQSLSVNNGEQPREACIGDPQPPVEMLARIHWHGGAIGTGAERGLLRQFWRQTFQLLDLPGFIHGKGAEAVDFPFSAAWFLDERRDLHSYAMSGLQDMWRQKWKDIPVVEQLKKLAGVTGSTEGIALKRIIYTPRVAHSFIELAGGYKAFFLGRGDQVLVAATRQKDLEGLISRVCNPPQRGFFLQLYPEKLGRVREMSNDLLVFSTFTQWIREVRATGRSQEDGLLFQIDLLFK